MRQTQSYLIREGGDCDGDQSLMLLKQYDGKQVKNMKITKAFFRVRINDLPFMAPKDYIRRLINISLGQMKEVNLEVGEVEWGEFMRVQVKLDIEKPLVRRKKIALSDMDPIWISFTYERLLDYCICCGILGHSHKQCKH